MVVASMYKASVQMLLLGVRLANDVTVEMHWVGNAMGHLPGPIHVTPCSVNPNYYNIYFRVHRVTLIICTVNLKASRSLVCR